MEFLPDYPVIESCDGRTQNRPSVEESQTDGRFQGVRIALRCRQLSLIAFVT